MKKSKEKVLHTIIVIVSIGVPLGVLIILANLGFLSLTEEYSEYCVEWDFWIDREDLLTGCYDFVTKEQKCYPIINITQNRLSIYNISDSNLIHSFECTKYLKSYLVDGG